MSLSSPEEPVGEPASTIGRIVELATRVKHVRGRATEFLRRWAVEHDVTDPAARRCDADRRAPARAHNRFTRQPRKTDI